MGIAAFCTVLVAYVGIGHLSAQPVTPNLSGTWTLDLTKSDFGPMHRAVFFKPRVFVEKSPWRIPTDWVSTVQPQPQFDSVEGMLANRRSVTGLLTEKFQSLFQHHLS